MANGHGGAGRGQGRKPGSANLKTRAIADKRAADGKITPLEVMLDNMDFYYGRADQVLEKLLTEIPQAGAAVAASGEDPAIAQAGAEIARKSAIDTLRDILGLRELAGKWAEAAAPFSHARISPVAAKPDEQDDLVPLAERLAAYEREDAIEQSQGKVIELAKKKARRK